MKCELLWYLININSQHVQIITTSRVILVYSFSLSLFFFLFSWCEVWTSMIFNKYKFTICSNYNNFKGNSCVFPLSLSLSLSFTVLISRQLVISGYQTSHSMVSFLNCAVPTSYVIVFLSHLVVPLFIFSYLMVSLSY